MANEIERRYGHQGLHGLSAHPGVIKTGILRSASKEDVDSIFGAEHMQPLFKSPAQGAATIVWAAIGSELEGRGGLYLADLHIPQPPPADESGAGGARYCAAHAYDEPGAQQLWEASLKMVGAQER